MGGAQRGHLFDELWLALEIGDGTQYHRRHG